MNYHQFTIQDLTPRSSRPDPEIFARYGVDPATTNEVTRLLMQRLATAIVTMVAPHDEAIIRAANHTATNQEDDESITPLFSPGAALVVLPFQAGGTA